jgi:putative phosphonate metabolism protein
MGAFMFTRYAIYYTPTGTLADLGSAWLGWNIANGISVQQPSIAEANLELITRQPRRYGFHATIKPPFRLADGHSEAGLLIAFEALCRNLGPVTLDGLTVQRMGRFLALMPEGSQSALRDLAANVVRDLDPFRAPPDADELARRRKAKLSAAQEANLLSWGYPHVMDAFRFHMTLTGRLDAVDDVQHSAAAYFKGALPVPFVINALTLVGEGADGMFHQIKRLPLLG